MDYAACPAGLGSGIKHLTWRFRWGDAQLSPACSKAWRCSHGCPVERQLLHESSTAVTSANKADTHADPAQANTVGLFTLTLKLLSPFFLTFSVLRSKILPAEQLSPLQAF